MSVRVINQGRNSIRPTMLEGGGKGDTGVAAAKPQTKLVSTAQEREKKWLQKERTKKKPHGGNQHKGASGKTKRGVA